jgi:hypothetical protein
MKESSTHAGNVKHVLLRAQLLIRVTYKSRGRGGRVITGGSTEDCNRRIEEMCAAGRRVVGFTPIEPRMLYLHIQSYGARNMEEAMLMEIQS